MRVVIHRLPGATRLCSGGLIVSAVNNTKVTDVSETNEELVYKLYVRHGQTLFYLFT